MRIRTPSRHDVARTSLGIALIGLLVRATVKDRFAVSALAYYALPLVVIAALLLVTASIRIAGRRRRIGLALLLASAASLASWVLSSHYAHPLPPACRNAVRVLQWNAGRPHGDPSKALRPVLDEQPDIAVIVESGEIARLAETRILLPKGYRVCNLGGGLCVVTRGTVANTSLTTFGSRNRIAACTVRLGPEAVSVMAVDIDSNPFRTRSVAMEVVRDMASRTQAEIIAGDFNTPSDSVWFDELRDDYLESFETAGSGLCTTWPSGMPVLAIDHIWVRRPLRVCSACIRTTRASDHRMVVADVEPR